MLRVRWVLLALAVVAAPQAGRADVVGQATVIDGDTLEIRGRRGVPLRPEGGLRARRPHRPADRHLRAQGHRPLRPDRRRLRGWRRGPQRLSGARGWALAYREYSDAYVDEEAAARAEGLGLWRGAFVPPWDWRCGVRLAQPAANDNESGDCRIKGNVNRDGARIYHVPGGRWYDRTEVDESDGERWFCSEAEARAAGWRRARN